MKFSDERIYHIYNRGNKKQKTFFKADNYLYFLRKAKTELLPYCKILAYCLMPNHFHFIVLIKTTKKISIINKNDRSKTLNNAIAILLRSYTRSMQSQENFTGSLFQQKTKAKELTDSDNTTFNYLSLCAHYIHFNPLKAKLVKDLKEWEFSSYLDYMKLRNDTLCSKTELYLNTGLDEEAFIKESSVYQFAFTEMNSSSDHDKEF